MSVTLLFVDFTLGGLSMPTGFSFLWTRGGVLHQIFGTRVQHMEKKWTQSDLNFCINEGVKKFKLMEKGVNWIENEGKIDTKCLKSVK